MKKENSDTLASCSVNADLTENHINQTWWMNEHVNEHSSYLRFLKW